MPGPRVVLLERVHPSPTASHPLPTGFRLEMDADCLAEHEDIAGAIAQEGGVRLMRGRELSAVMLKDNLVVGGLWTGACGQTFTFDVAVIRAEQGKGLGLSLAKHGRRLASEMKEAGFALELTAISAGGAALARKLDMVATEHRPGLTLFKQPDDTRAELDAAACNLIAQFPKVCSGKECAGWVVRDKVDNRSSIEATLGSDYETHGVREVPMRLLGPDPGFDVREKLARRPDVVALAERMKASGYLTPLIVVVNGLCGGQEGPGYVLEGFHRIDALELLGAKSFPALVVQDTNPSIAERDQAGRLMDPRERFALPAPVAPDAALLKGRKVLAAPSMPATERPLATPDV